MANQFPEYVANCPCRECEDRKMGCHAICKLYLEYREKLEEKKKEIHLQAVLDAPNEEEKREMAHRRRRKWKI